MRTLRELLALCSCLIVSLASAQVPPPTAEAEVARGITLTERSAVLVNEATALSLNPAALQDVGGLQVHYLHERSLARNRVADGAFVGATLFGGLGLGASMEWLRSSTGPDARRTSWGLSLGGEEASVGLAYRTYASNEALNLNRLSSLDLGLRLHVARALALAAAVRNLDAPRRGPLSLPREYNLALGLRPFGERFSFAVDALWDDVGGPSAGRLTYSLQSELLRGFHLGANVSHGLTAGAPLLLQLAATVDTSFAGVRYAVQGEPQGLTHVVGVRLSADAYPSVLRRGKVAVLDLQAMLANPQNPVLSLLGFEGENRYVRLTRWFDGAVRDPDLKAVVVKVEFLDGGMGQAEELRDALLDLRAAGKQVIAVLYSATDADYLIASAADRVVSVPESLLLVDGFRASTLFLGQAMQNLGVTWDVARVGDYKNAPDTLTRSNMSDEQRKAINAYLDTFVRTFSETVTRSRNLTPQALQAAINEGLKAPERAQALSLVDEVLPHTELDERVKQWVPGARLVPGYAPNTGRETRWASRRQVAVVPVIGTIAAGRSQQDPTGLGEIAGADSITRAIERASRDPAVSAIVLRIDSGGGDGLASDLIYRAVLEAKKRKPVVASMGDVAASGGYYVAMGADEIFANATTLTGSIGVFLMKPAFKGLAQKLGIHQEAITRGELAGVLDLYEPWTAAERSAAQQWVEAFYQGFVREVARSRGMKTDEVDGIARGRVWSGADAKERRLVDQLGGLREAIAAARQRAGVPEHEEIDLVTVSATGGWLSNSPMAQSAAHALLPELAAPPNALGALARELGLHPGMLRAPKPMAMLEYSIRVR